MIKYKNIAVLLVVLIAVFGSAVYCSFKILGKCINDVKYANAESFENSDKTEKKQILGKEIKNLSFLNGESNYSIAENGKRLYFYCKNQFLETSYDMKCIYYFCYDRPVGTPALGERECAERAEDALSECISDHIDVPFREVSAAFDGGRYIYYFSIGEYGGATVHVASDSGKVLLFDGRNINIS